MFKVEPDFFSGRDVYESATLISPSAILDFHSQHSVHSAPGSRKDGMALCPFQNRNAEYMELKLELLRLYGDPH